ncbi:MAG: SurA N-terminal domain-containing protein, partial [Pseudomonadota bacterium]
AIRKRSGSIVVKILFGLLILSFGVWGIGDFLTPKAQDKIVATVGEASISAVDLERQAETEIRRMRELLGARFDREQARALGLYNAVLAQMIQEAVLDQAALRAGLVITDAALRAEIEATPTFRGALGTFDRARFQQFLQAAGFSETAYISLLKRAILRDVLIEAALVPVTPPKAATAVLYRERGEKRTAEAVLVKDTAQTAPVAPGEDEIAAFHQANAQRFTAPEYRAVTLARMDVDDIAREIAVSEDDLKQAFEARAADFDLPERRRLKQMVFRDEEPAKRGAEALARGADFATVARDEAKMDPAAIELGALARDQIPADLADPVFSLAAGGITAPLKSPVGWHIVKVVAVEPPQKRTLSDVREALAKDVARDKALDGLVGLANRFEDALGGGAPLEAAAAAIGIRVIKVQALDTRGNGPDGKPIAAEGLPKLDLLAQIAFATAEGTESPLAEMGENGYFALRVDKITPPALKPLADVRGEVLAAWRAQKLSELAKAEAEALAQDARAGESLKAAAEKRKLSASEFAPVGRDGGGVLPPPAAAALFGLAQSGEIAVARTAEGYHVVRLGLVHAADPAQDADGLGKIAQALAKDIGNDLQAAFQNALRREIPVKIRESNLDRIFR